MLAHHWSKTSILSGDLPTPDETRFGKCGVHFENVSINSDQMNSMELPCLQHCGMFIWRIAGSPMSFWTMLQRELKTILLLFHQALMSNLTVDTHTKPFWLQRGTLW